LYIDQIHDLLPNLSFLIDWVQKIVVSPANISRDGFRVIMAFPAITHPALHEEDPWKSGIVDNISYSVLETPRGHNFKQGPCIRQTENRTKTRCCK
jgi:hypothetical protein